MEIKDILDELAYDTGDLPRDAIESAIAKRKEITGHLLCILENAVNRVDEIIRQDNYQGHLYAIYLLAQFREKAAYPLILKLISFPGEIPHAIAGDFLTEDLGRILASLCFGEIGAIKKLIEESSVNEYVRAAGLSALVTLVGCGLKDRMEIVNYFGELFAQKLEKKSSFVWDQLVLSSIELYPEELAAQIALAFESELVHEKLVTEKEVALALEAGRESILYRLSQKAELIDDVVTEMEKWYSPQGV